MVAAAALALTLLVGPTHARSEGRSVFSLDEQGRVSITITLGQVDLPELCDADFSLKERAREEQKLTRCLARDLPLLVRVKADGKPCKLVSEGFQSEPPRVHIAARADCGAYPESWSVDWGLFVASPLDHVNVARLEQPWSEPRMTLLSKRAARVTWETARHPARRAAGIALVLGAALLVVVGAVRRHRRGRSAARPASP